MMRRGEMFSDDIYRAFETLSDEIERGIDENWISPEKITLVIAGSAPLIYNEWIPYGTEDIDCIQCSDGWLEQFFPQLNINMRIQAYSDSWTYNYDERMEVLYESAHLLVMRMCLEDLIFMKLSRWAENDIEDICALIENGIEIDFDLLEHLVFDEEESRGAGMTDRTYDELLAAYSDFKKRVENDDWQPCR